MSIIHSAKVHRYGEDINKKFSFNRNFFRQNPPLCRTVVNRVTGLRYFCKTYTTTFEDHNHLLLIRNEIQVHQQLFHPNVIKLLEIFEDSQEVHLIFEYIAGTDLLQYISERGALSPMLALHFVKQILELLEFSRQANLVFRDLSPSNWIISDSVSPRIILTSLYVVSHMSSTHRLKGQVGPIEMMAPEMLQGEYGHRVDMWSLGVLMYIMLVGVPPFPGPPALKEERIMSLNINTDCRRWLSLPVSVQDFVRECLTDAGARLSPKESLKMSIITSITGPLPTSKNCILSVPKLGFDLETARIRLIEDFTNRLQYRCACVRPLLYDTAHLSVMEAAIPILMEGITDEGRESSRHSYKLAAMLERASLRVWCGSGTVRKCLMLMYAQICPSKALEGVTQLYEHLRGHVHENVVLTTSALESHLTKRGDMYHWEEITSIIRSLDFYNNDWIPLIRFQAAFVGSPLLPIDLDVLTAVFQKIPVDDKKCVATYELTKIFGLKITNEKLREEIVASRVVGGHTGGVEWIPHSKVSGLIMRGVPKTEEEFPIEPGRTIYELRDVVLKIPSHRLDKMSDFSRTNYVKPSIDQFSNWVGPLMDNYIEDACSPRDEKLIYKKVD
eukprot:GHVH01006527.1.p1 GENE.GHVH01006527.1~~GHVH01006527.1.p1  ORF type:complete len:615 (+),score=55.62 GHVH01006527.1:244-2088(+)